MPTGVVSLIHMVSAVDEGSNTIRVTWSGDISGVAWSASNFELEPTLEVSLAEIVDIETELLIQFLSSAGATSIRLINSFPGLQFPDELFEIG